MLSAGPGTVADSVDVPLAYPRHQVTTRSDPSYLALRERLYRGMTEQVTRARNAAA